MTTKITPGPIETRFFPRAEISEACTIEYQKNVFTGILKNISEGGALIAVANDLVLPITANVQVQFRLGQDSPSVETQAKVQWTRPHNDHTHFIGIEFEDLRQAQLDHIRKYVERYNPMFWESPLPKDIAVSYVPVIRREAHRLAKRLPNYISVDDLVGSGFVGLVEAYQHYNPALCDRFEPYALMRIRGSMLDELRGNDNLSRTMRQRAKLIQQTTLNLERGSGRTPSEIEVAQSLDMSLEDYRACLQAVQTANPVSMERNEKATEIPDVDALRPDELLEEEEVRKKLQTAISALPPRLREILEMHYGQDLTLRAIGGILGVTQSRVSQLLADAVRRVREEI